MTITVTRHSSPGPDDEGYAERLGQNMARNTAKLERSPASIDSMLGTAVLHVQARSIVDPRAARIETWEAVVTAMQVYSALFAVTGATEGTVQCRINHEVRTLPAIGPRPYADAGNWLTAFWLAVVCRDQKRLTELSQIPLDRLRSEEGAYDDYIYHWVAALQAYWSQRPGLVEELTAAMQQSHPDVATIAPRDRLQQVLYPPINLFYRFLRQDAPGFNQALTEALELHKAYWTADEDRTDDPSGMMALAPLAIACLAHDGGIPIEVESDYLPKHLLERGWLGEFEV
ncbi:immunity 49 family protein [Streptomyces griseoaurantiacus]|uniref:Immunity protein 49 n=1 Tax=Streptomyces griseoaurantiacus TaxID=68213 RepID=A0A1G7RTQ2_9ACTN|nr:immunity 49 family protein [Streptomyces jietaisiensis]SDG14141.1 Immunity protein 49 [Streptomyces jietaisiensis]